MISKVLVAIDGSECGGRALDFALDVADKFGASLSILNVLSLPVSSANPDEPFMSSINFGGFLEDLRNFHWGLLNRAKSRAVELKPNLVVKALLREGNAHGQIVAVAEEGKFDLIVLGHTGQSRIRELILGSTTEKVVHLAHCNVVVVK